jgi:carbon storage regulator CsrA
MEIKMLVLSRRTNETIRFPQLGIAVSIVSVRGNRVQVGVDAPPEIHVLRKELESTPANSPVAALLESSEPSKGTTDIPTVRTQADKDRHDFRNRLNQATLGLHLAQKQLAAGHTESANKSLANALLKLTELEKASMSENTSPRKPIRLAAYSANVKLQETSNGNRFAKTQSNVGQSAEASPEPIDVLLVEDDQNEQALMRTLLEMEGYRVHTASNGVEALQCLENVTPQCVLLDMMMPECDGPETLERMRAIPRLGELPVFAVSGTSPQSVGLSVGTDGIDDWFPKPLNASRLVKQMRERITSLCS